MIDRITFGSLFAGIGGFDLGLERAGMECKWQVEIDDYATRVLKKHWPDVRRWDDVRTFPPPGDWDVDVICGGFPCQDISTANANAEGLSGERSGLWWEFARIVRTLRPRFVVVENVPALTVRGFDQVLGRLAKDGYDAEWRVLSAREFGAPHIRKRLFIVANARSERIHLERGWFGRAGREGEVFVDGDGQVCEVADAGGEGLPTPEQCGVSGEEEKGQQARPAAPQRGWWSAEPHVGRVANGVSSRVDRLKGLGNAVVPQVAEWIGRRIVEGLNEQHRPRHNDD